MGGPSASRLGWRITTNRKENSMLRTFTQDYGCETWSLKLREEHRLRVFENRILGRISGPKREEVVRGWRRLHNEELHNMYVSLNIKRLIK
jgi:hypothetical protein